MLCLLYPQVYCKVINLIYNLLKLYGNTYYRQYFVGCDNEPNYDRRAYTQRQEPAFSEVRIIRNSKIYHTSARTADSSSRIKVCYLL